jgi:NTE family protein
MSDRAIRLMDSLRWLERRQDKRLIRRTTGATPRTTSDEGSRAVSDHELRRAFPFADDMSIRMLARICTSMSVPGDAPLIREGQQPDAVYIVVTGLLAAIRPADDGQEIVLESFGADDVIGDIGFITGEASAVTIKALRNSELLCISGQHLARAGARRPAVLQAISSGAIRRLQCTQPITPLSLRPRTVCLVPADPTISLRPFMQKIAASLEVFGTVAILPAEQTSGQGPAWLSQIEKSSDFVLLEAESSGTAWTRFCLRQCDRIVLVAHGDTEPADCQALASRSIDGPRTTPLSLMLLWPQAIVPERTTRWLTCLSPSGHHHIRSPADLERASRLIAGRGLGLVLSGGGARALAHLGVIDALRMHDIQIDAIGGTSVGGIIAAVFALEWDLATTVRSLAEAFGRRRFSDFAVPRTALYSERAFARTLGHCFGDIAVEDSPIPLFCVSTNLTKGMSSVHRSGRLVTWLRATSAVPGICPPIMEQNAVYVDGGILNNMPTDSIRDFGVASVISVDVGSSLQGQARSDGGSGLPNIWDLLWRVGTIGSDTATQRKSREGDVMLRPEVGNVGLFDWNTHERSAAAGYQVVLEHLDEIKAARDRLHAARDAAFGNGAQPPLCP